MSDTTTTTTEATEAPAGDVETADTAAATDWQQEAEKWKSQARKHEERAKANSAAARELEQLRQASMSEQEKAVAQARAEARVEALREVAVDRVEDALRVAAAGRLDEPTLEALFENLDRTRFLADDTTVDTAKVQEWIARLAPAAAEEGSAQRFPDLGQGARGGPQATALNSDPLLADLKRHLGIR